MVVRTFLDPLLCYRCDLEQCVAFLSRLPPSLRILTFSVVQPSSSASSSRLSRSRSRRRCGAGFLPPLTRPPRLTFSFVLQNFNFACVIFAAVTVMGIVSWWIVPEENWLSRRAVGRIHDAAEGHNVDADSAPAKLNPEHALR